MLLRSRFFFFFFSSSLAAIVVIEANQINSFSRLPRVGQDVSVLRDDADADLVGRALDAEADVHDWRGDWGGEEII